jgi:uncharacterized phosphosugar-binding protein
MSAKCHTWNQLSGEIGSMDNIHDYYEKVNSYMLRIIDEENENLEKAANYIGDWLSQDRIHLLHAIGTGGHSMMGVNEIYKRAGCFAQVDPLFTDAMNYERVPGMITQDIEKYVLHKDEPVLIISHVGMNAFTIETAKLCRNKGMYLIGVESKKICEQLPSDFKGRAPSKLNLHDICDVTIDHKTPFGDTLVQIPGINCRMGPVSNILIFFTLHLLEIKIAERMTKNGYQPSIFTSENIPGGLEANNEFWGNYKSLIKHWW